MIENNTWSFNNTMLKLLPDTLTYKVLARPPYSTKAYRIFREFEDLQEAMATAARLEKNTDMEVIVEMPDGALQNVTLTALELKA